MAGGRLDIAAVSGICGSDGEPQELHIDPSIRAIDEPKDFNHSSEPLHLPEPSEDEIQATAADLILRCKKAQNQNQDSGDLSLNPFFWETDKLEPESLHPEVLRGIARRIRLTDMHILTPTIRRAEEEKRKRYGNVRPFIVTSGGAVGHSARELLYHMCNIYDGDIGAKAAFFRTLCGRISVGLIRWGQRCLSNYVSPNVMIFSDDGRPHRGSRSPDSSASDEPEQHDPQPPPSPQGPVVPTPSASVASPVPLPPRTTVDVGDTPAHVIARPARRDDTVGVFAPAPDHVNTPEPAWDIDDPVPPQIVEAIDLTQEDTPPPRQSRLNASADAWNPSGIRVTFATGTGVRRRL